MSDATFDRLMFWRDPMARSGPENMAVDEWLLENVSEPLLRSYEWDGEWASLGYFGRWEDTRGIMRGEGRCWVRRLTGGGIVDHGSDRTYSLVIPASEPMASMGRAESYRSLHGVMVDVLQGCGREALMVSEDDQSASAACFEKRVVSDVVDGTGRKIAGGAQRRTRAGLLHQGSVVVSGDSTGLLGELAGRLAREVETVRREPSNEELAAMVEKYASREWLERR